MRGVVHLWVDRVARDPVDQLLALLLLHLAALFGGDLDLAARDDLRDDLQGIGRPEHLFEVVLGGPIAPRGVLEDVLGRDDVLQVAIELAALDGQRRVGVDQYLEALAVGFEAGGDGLVE
ncbi:hypothetical protein GCM10027355_03730 [Haloplanus salinarum]